MIVQRIVVRIDWIRKVDSRWVDVGVPQGDGGGTARRRVRCRLLE